MSAVEALAEVLVPHSFMARYTVNTDGSWTWKCSCGHEYRYGVEITDQEIQHRAQAVVAAIRSMPAEQVAELIGGTVERRNGWGPPKPESRVVTAWTTKRARPVASSSNRRTAGHGSASKTCASPTAHTSASAKNCPPRARPNWHGDDTDANTQRRKPPKSNG